MAMTSGPLSDLMYAGGPRRMNRDEQIGQRIYHVDKLSLRFTRIMRTSRVYSSMMLSMR